MLKAIGSGFDDNEFFGTTNLNLEKFQIIDDVAVYCTNFDNDYYLSLCLFERLFDKASATHLGAIKYFT